MARKRHLAATETDDALPVLVNSESLDAGELAAIQASLASGETDATLVAPQQQSEEVLSIGLVKRRKLDREVEPRPVVALSTSSEANEELWSQPIEYSGGGLPLPKTVSQARRLQRNVQQPQASQLTTAKKTAKVRDRSKLTIGDEEEET